MKSPSIVQPSSSQTKVPNTRYDIAEVSLQSSGGSPENSGEGKQELKVEDRVHLNATSAAEEGPIEQPEQVI